MVEKPSKMNRGPRGGSLTITSVTPQPKLDRESGGRPPESKNSAIRLARPILPSLSVWGERVVVRRKSGLGCRWRERSRSGPALAVGVTARRESTASVGHTLPARGHFGTLSLPERRDRTAQVATAASAHGNGNHGNTAPTFQAARWILATISSTVARH